MKTHWLTLTAALALTLTACADEQSGQIETRFSMAIADEGRLIVDRLDVQVDEVVFDADGPNGSISLSVEQRTGVDVRTGTAVPDVVPVTLDSGQWESIYLGVEVWDDAPLPAIELEGALEGTPLLFVFNSAETFEASTDALHVPAGQAQVVEFILDPEAWFTDIDPGSLTLDSNGVAVLSTTSNAAAHDTVADLLDVTTDGVFPGGSDDEI